MKQKHVFLLVAIMVALIGLSTSTMVAQNGEKIELNGSYASPKTRSLIVPFEVRQGASFLTVDYLQTLSNITIAVEDEQGEVVYSTNVNPVSGAELVIDIFDWEAGFYTIYISNATGGLLYGDFEIE